MTGDHRATLWALAWLTATACASSEPETPLRIDGMSPEAGSARGGTTVEIRGAGLPAQASVLFGQVAAETTTTSGDTLTVRTPPGIAGEVVVTVVVGDGSHPVPGAFTYEKLTLALFDLAPERLAPRALWGGGAAAADVDGDGDLDVLQAGGLEGLLLHDNEGEGRLATVRAFLPVGPGATNDGEGGAGGGGGDGGASADGGAGGDTGAPAELAPARYHDLAVGDVSGDGVADVLVLSDEPGRSGLLRGTGGDFVPAIGALPPGLPGLRAAVLVDVDGDGDLDLAALTVGAEPSALLLHNDGGTFRRDDAGLPVATWPASGSVTAADVDGDGATDLLFAGATGRSRLLLGDGGGVFRLAAPDALPDAGATPADGSAGSPAFGDLDGDGTLDVYLPRAGLDRVWLGDGSGRFFDVTATWLGDASGEGRAARVDDLDRDGWLDVVVASGSAPVRLLRNDGKGRLFDYTGKILPNPALDQAGLALGDFDGDGDTDVFVSRAGGSRAALLVSWGPEPAADTDGDGLPDAADNCPDEPNPTQDNRDIHPFGCVSAAACATETGCTLEVTGDIAWLVCRDQPLSWAAAVAACAARDGSLATVADADEDAALATLGVDGSWLGTSDAVSEGTWVSVPGGVSGYTGWAEGEPNGDGNCAARTATGWNDVACEDTRPWICRDTRGEPPDAGDACDECPDRSEPGDCDDGEGGAAGSGGGGGANG